MEWIGQTRRRNCGQTCLAMVTGVSVEEVERTLGKTGSTRTADLVRWLRKQGWECEDRLQKVGLPEQIGIKPLWAIAKVAQRAPDGRLKPNWHWVVLWEGQWFDPERPGHSRPPGEWTSYLRLTKSGAKRSRPVPA